MTQPRSQLVLPSHTRFYHCVSRCVRRAWLCGEDDYTGKNFDHRKPWLLERMKLLEEVFAIGIAAYAVMSNHYHVVLYMDLEQGEAWGREEVVRRWLRLFRGDPLAHAYLRGELDEGKELEQLDALVSIWRDRLCDLSWFMRCLNEHVARRANAEDDCTGRFWEGRFKCQALVDEAALLSCMAYVDLNPVRAGRCSELQDADFTSIQVRLWQLSEVVCEGRQACEVSPESLPEPELMRFCATDVDRSGTGVTGEVAGQIAGLPFGLRDYIELVDWTGRMVRSGKRGVIPKDSPAVLSRLGLTGAQWRVLSLDIQKQSIAMFHGLNRLAAWERRLAKHAA